MGKHSAAPIGRLYMDALGDPGRSPGSLPTYAVCTIWVAHPEEELEEMFAKARQVLGLRTDYEFHARQLTSRDWAKRLPEQFFQLLIDYGLSIECWCAEVQKNKSRLPLSIAGKALTHELVAQTLMRMPRERAKGQTLIIDEQAKGKAPKVIAELRSSVKHTLEQRSYEYPLAKISARPAHQKAGLQLADFLAAALVEPCPSCIKLLKQWPVDHWRTWLFLERGYGHTLRNGIATVLFNRAIHRGGRRHKTPAVSRNCNPSRGAAGTLALGKPRPLVRHPLTRLKLSVSCG